MNTPWKQFVDNAKRKNNPGRGRPYSIRNLLLWAGLAQTPGQRRVKITEHRRLTLADLLDAEGLTYDWLLDDSKEVTHVWLKA